MSFLRYHFTDISNPDPLGLNVDICVYGQSAGAITAAVQAANSGLRCALIVNSAWIGGLTSGGLGCTDIGNEAAIGGLAREFYRRVGSYYGVEEEWYFEPHVAEKVLHGMLDEAGVVPRLKQHLRRAVIEKGRIVSIECESGLTVRAHQYIDASYEGDLMAAAGVSWTSGREGNTVHGELVNGVQIRELHQFEVPISPYRREGDPASGLLPGINGEAPAPQGSGDHRIQAYNFRMCLTRFADRLPFQKPDDYRPEDYELLARYLRSGWKDVFHKFDPIRGGKTDTNNHGAFSTDLVGGSDRFPHVSNAEREAIFQRHVTYQQGLMWFLANDSRVPDILRNAMKGWGLAADEFCDTDGWSRQLYIRECRRMRSDYVVTELDCRGYRRGDDPVGLGAYALDSHNCQRVVIGDRVLNEGDVQVSGFDPYPIPFRAIVPARGECGNLTVPVCLSASHVAYGSIRMEPVFMVLGQSAAMAAVMALKEGYGAVGDVPYSLLRRRLEQSGQKLEGKKKTLKWIDEGIPAAARNKANTDPVLTAIG